MSDSSLHRWASLSTIAAAAIAAGALVLSYLATKEAADAQREAAAVGLLQSHLALAMDRPNLAYRAPSDSMDVRYLAYATQTVFVAEAIYSQTEGSQGWDETVLGMVRPPCRLPPNRGVQLPRARRRVRALSGDPPCSPPMLCPLPMTRRTALRTISAASAAALLGCNTSATPNPLPSPSLDWEMPDEGAPHVRTWMAFGASASIWGRDLLPAVQEDLALLASTIARFEPVSMLVRPADRARAEALVEGNVTLVDAALDDLWIRDTGPTFVQTENGTAGALDLNFNGWGNKQTHAYDRRVAALIAQRAGVPRVTTRLVLEGGCLEVDGHGTAIITESCVLNTNRNPGVSKAQFEDALMPLLGLDKIIWLPGIKGKDITDGHTDFYARFAAPGVVIAGYDPDPASYDHAVTTRHLDLLRAATDAHGRRLDVRVLEGPSTLRPEALQEPDFAAGYIGYYLCNGAVIMQSFGDAAADRAAQGVLRRAYPGRQIVALNMDAIATGGGSIHCATQQQPA